MDKHDFKRFPELTNNQMNFYYFDSPHRQITEDFFARVIDVHDGDTIRIRWDERDFDFPVRFSNIAAPELEELGGKESQRWLEGRLLNKDILIIIDDKNRVEKWGRLLGKIISDGIDVGEESVNNGMSKRFGDFAEGVIIDFMGELDAVKL